MSFPAVSVAQRRLANAESSGILLVMTLLARLTNIAIFLALLTIPACPSCPGPVTNPKAWTDCSAKTVKEHTLSLVAPVNDCLVQLNYASCLVALINPAIGITEDTLACVVNYRQNAFAANVAANPADTVSATAAQNAAAFIRDRGYKFSPPPDEGSGAGGETAH